MKAGIHSAALIALVVISSDSRIVAAADLDQDAAWMAWEQGDIAHAAVLAKKLAESPMRNHLLFLCSFATGQFDAALTRYGDIAPTYDRYAELNYPVTECYLHLGRYEDAVKFARTRGSARLTALQMRARRPLKVSLDKLSVIPFAEHRLGEYFPAFAAELEGQSLILHVDTGGGFLVMGPHHAQSLGIELIDFGFGSHGYRRRVRVSFGIARTFKLGDAILENVPVVVLATLQHVTFGTNVLQQFHATLDYPNGRLILSPRASDDLRTEHMALLPTDRREVPFYMWGDHFMFARGSFGDATDVNYFIDSGLVQLQYRGNAGIVQACCSSSKERYLSWGYSEAEIEQNVFRSRHPIGLGPLRQHGLWCGHGPGSETHGNKNFGGVQMHAVLSHAFFKRYAWSLDFEMHKYIFSGIGQE